jgi:hypothetical protein
MHESNIENNNAPDVFAAYEELTPERKKMIENKLENALLKVLLQEGGEVVLLRKQTTDEINQSPTDYRL